MDWVVVSPNGEPSAALDVGKILGLVEAAERVEGRDCKAMLLPFQDPGAGIAAAHEDVREVGLIPVDHVVLVAAAGVLFFILFHYLLFILFSFFLIILSLLFTFRSFFIYVQYCPFVVPLPFCLCILQLVFALTFWSLLFRGMAVRGVFA